MGAPGGGSGGGGGRSPPLSDGGSPSPPSAHSARDPDERDNLTDDNASDVDDHDDKDDHDTPYNGQQHTTYPYFMQHQLPNIILFANAKCVERAGAVSERILRFGSRVRVLIY